MVHLQQRRLTSLALGMGMDSSNIMKCWQIANQNNGSHAKAEVEIAVRQGARSDRHKRYTRPCHFLVLSLLIVIKRVQYSGET